MLPEPPRTIEALISSRFVEKRTQMEDAAERYFCHRTGRTLWVEPENPKERSVDDAPRYLVDDGTGDQTFYQGEDVERAIEKLVVFNKFARGPAVTEREDVGACVAFRSASS